MTREQAFLFKNTLKKTWNVFFHRFSNLSQIQILTIPVVLQGKNAVIVSPTASGKTEAVIAPVVEKLLTENWKPLSILYISPTRALVNDVYYRISEQLSELEISTAFQTGDKSNFNYKKPQDLLITTPESLDSLICRHPLSLKNVKTVIIDEIHFIDNTYRGDQLRFLLKRLKFISSGNNFKIYILSATIPKPEEVGSRYINDNFEIISAPGKREIEYTLVSSIEDVFYFAQKEKLKKILIFCNQISSVEHLANVCRKLWKDNLVVVHHGSLSKQLREEAENFMKFSQSGICIATMTLEIGIDIGDIDAVVLAEIPWSISSALQRIGRTNRRSQKSRVFAIYGSKYEKLILEKMFQIITSGYTEPTNYSPDLSVVIQQIFSALYSRPSGLPESYFFEICPPEFYPEEILKKIINHLSTLGFIERKHNKLFASSKLMDLGEKGLIHSNIPSGKNLEVIDTSSASLIGYIQYPIDNIFALGGKVWEIVDIVDDKIFVKPKKSIPQKVKFKTYTSKGNFYYLLPPEISFTERDRLADQKDTNK